MLDFIVLGIVPGTTFTITFWWSLGFGLVFALFVLTYIELRRPRKTKADAMAKVGVKRATAQAQLA
jgi:hypothetical protein